MLRLDLIEQKVNNILDKKNKVETTPFIEKSLYYQNNVVKSVAVNKGNLAAKELLGTHAVFPSDEVSADGSYLLYVSPRFAQGGTVYKLFNNESGNEIRNTVKVKEESLEKYVYQADPEADPAEVTEDGEETLEVENFDRAVQRNRESTVKTRDTTETPEEYQERFMREYQDLVRDINGALEDVDPEFLRKQWLQKKKENEEKLLEQQNRQIAESAISSSQQAIEAVDQYEEQACGLNYENANKSLLFKYTILKASSTCQSLQENFNSQIQNLIDLLNSSQTTSNQFTFDTTELNEILNTTDSNVLTKIIENLKKAVSAVNNHKTSGDIIRLLTVAALYDAVTELGITINDNKESTKLVQYIDSAMKFFTNPLSGEQKKKLSFLFNSNAYSSKTYEITISDFPSIMQFARSLISMHDVSSGKSFYERLEERFPNRIVEGFLGELSLATISLTGLTDSSTTVEISSDPPSWIPLSTKASEYGKEGSPAYEPELLIADLQSFSTGKDSLQFDLPSIVENHFVNFSFYDPEFIQFTLKYTANLATKLGISCSSANDFNNTACLDLLTYSTFSLSKLRKSSGGSEANKGELFEELILLDNLHSMLPENLSTNPGLVRFNCKQGSEAVLEYLKCKTSDQERDYLADSERLDPSMQLKLKDGSITTVEESTKEIAKSVFESKEVSGLIVNQRNAYETKFKGYLPNGNTTQLDLNDKSSIETYFSDFAAQLEKDLAGQSSKKRRTLAASAIFEYTSMYFVGTNVNDLDANRKKIIEAFFNSAQFSDLCSKLKYDQDQIEKFKSDINGESIHLVNSIKKSLKSTNNNLSSNTTVTLDAQKILDVIQSALTIRAVSNVGILKKFKKALESASNNASTYVDSIIDECYSMLPFPDDTYKEIYSDAFKDKFFLLVLKAHQSFQENNAETISAIIQYARIEAFREIANKIPKDTKVEHLFLRETQDQFRQRVTSLIPTLGKFVETPIKAAVKGSVEKKRTVEKKQATPAQQIPSAVTPLSIEDTISNSFSNQQSYKTSKDFLSALGSILGENVTPRQIPKKLQNFLAGATDIFVNNEIVNNDGIINSLEIFLKGASVAGGEIKTTKANNIVTFEITITAVHNGKIVKIPITFSAQSKSLYMYNTVLKNIVFSGNPSTENCNTNGCPTTQVNNSLNLDAILTIQDDEGVNFFGISKLDDVPGDISGYGDVAHIKIRGIERGSNGNITQKQNGQIGLDTTVIECKVGKEKISQTSYGRLLAIQNGIAQATLGQINPGNPPKIQTLKPNVFTARVRDGSFSMERAQSSEEHTAKEQLSRFYATTN